MDYDSNLDPSNPPKTLSPDGRPVFPFAAILHTIALPRIVIMHTRKRPSGSESDLLRLRAELGRADGRSARLQQVIAIKNAAIALIPARLRLHYTPSQRMPILMIRAARGLNNCHVVHRFQVTV